jgi:4-carboxymuconolactone decarboxylase
VSDRYRQGLENFRRITGQAGKSLTDTFDKTAPDLERYLMEFVFGDIYSRPALDVKQRQIAAISALAALGTCQPQLVSCSVDSWDNYNTLKTILLGR